MTQLYTIPEVAAILKLSPGTLRNWLSARKITAHKIGDAVRFTSDDLQAIIEPQPAKLAQPAKKKERSPGKLKAGASPRTHDIISRACVAIPEVTHE